MIFQRPRLLTWTGAAATAALTLSSLAVVTAAVTPAQATASTPRPSAVSADFVPAAPLRQVLKQPDGTTFRAELSPARTGGLFETSGGYSVDRDASGVWRYVTGRAA